MTKLNRMVQTVMKDNQWPIDSLEHWHPSPDYKAQENIAVTPIHNLMGGFALAQQGLQPLSEFVEMCGTVDIAQWVSDVAIAVATHQGGKLADDKVMNRYSNLDYMTMVFNVASEAQQTALELKLDGKVARPDYVKHPEYQDTYDSPCLFAFVIAQVVKAACEFFSMEKKTLVYDTAYLLAFLPAMAGLNSEQACRDAMDITFEVKQ